jgi:hypothetical protein
LESGEKLVEIAKKRFFVIFLGKAAAWLGIYLAQSSWQRGCLFYGDFNGLFP